MISDKLKTLIDLTIGDGSIYEKQNAFVFECGHAIKQAAYAQHKSDMLKQHGFAVKDRLYTAKSGKNIGKTYFYFSIYNDPLLNTARKWTYNKNRKALDKALLRQLDARSLAYLFMDDGSVRHINYLKKGNVKYLYAEEKAHAYRFATECFSLDEVVLFQEWLKEKFLIQTSLERSANGYRTQILQESSKDIFKSIIEPFIIPSMCYKIQYRHNFKNVAYTIMAVEETERENTINCEATVQKKPLGV